MHGESSGYYPVIVKRSSICKQTQAKKGHFHSIYRESNWHITIIGLMIIHSIEIFMKKLQVFILAVLTCFLLLGGFAYADTEISSYKITLRNMQVGRLVFTHELNGTDYKISADFETEGMAQALFNTKINATSTGIGAQFGAYDPKNVHVEFNQDEIKSSQDITYENGLLVNLITDPRILTHIKPETQMGAVDPLTALGYMLRMLPFDRLCSLHVQVFDGVNAGRFSLSEPSLRKDGRFQCQGGFERNKIATDDFEEVTDKSTFYLTALYRVDRESGNFIIDRIVGDSIYGQFQMIREAQEPLSATPNELPLLAPQDSAN